MMKVIAAAALLAAALNAGEFELEDGDRVLFYGETEPAERLFTAFVETYALTRFPYRTVTFLHGGWGAEPASSYSPTVVLLLLGLDRGPCGSAEAFEAWAARQRRTLSDLRRNAPGARVTVVRPTPCPDARMAGFLKELDGPVDLDAPLARAVAGARATDPRLADAIAADPFRPGPGGHDFVAGRIVFERGRLERRSAHDVPLDVEVTIQVGFRHPCFVARQKHPAQCTGMLQHENEAGRAVARGLPGGSIP